MYQLHLARQDPRFTEYRELTQEAPYPHQIFTQTYEITFTKLKSKQNSGAGEIGCVIVFEEMASWL